MIDNIHIVAKYLERGPGKLVSNLRKGLELLGIEEVSFDKAEHIACLQWGDTWPDISKFDGKRALIGPNIWEAPSHRPEVAVRFQDFITPSEWVKQKHLSDPLMKNKNIHVWSGGLETDTWIPSTMPKDIDCFIYFKNRDRSELEEVIDIVQCEKNIAGPVPVIEYGSYHITQLLELSQRAKFCIFLNNTESQGYSYMQVLSVNTPCLIIDRDYLRSRDGSQTWPATSAPYFDDRCGRKVKTLTTHNLDLFLSSINSYNPRNYILEHHTIEKSVKRYLEILENVS